MRPLRVAARERRRMVELVLLIEAEPARAFTLEQLARTAELSSIHFLRLFSAVFGVSPHQYLIRTRLARAARWLLEGERSITQIPYEVGFRDLSNFVRTFHRAAGRSPRSFRAWARAGRSDASIFPAE